jgi:adenosylmethionine-8-amino-7-oxononanoate aminotransferase
MTAMTDLPSFLHPFARPAATRKSFLNIVSATGCEVIDAEGHRYIDALASLWYCNVGHGRGEIAEAVAAQMRTLDAFHTFEKFTNPVIDSLADRITALAPMPDARVFFTCGGSESVETAVKLARVAQAQAGHPERTVIVARQPSYHGVSYAALSATGLPANQDGFGPLVPDVVQVPYNDTAALDNLAARLDGRVAAVIAEPVVGAGGVYPPPPGYFTSLRRRCDQWGAYLIIDEIICGFGRLGEWWGSTRFGVRPDLVTFAKGVTSGYLPLGGVLVGPAIRRAIEADGSFVLRDGYTYSGHPVPAAAAHANLDVIEQEGLLTRAPQIGQRLGQGLRELVDGEHVTETRGELGIWALGLGPGVPATTLRDALLEQGVIARPLGDRTLAYCPPLVITEAQIDRCLEATDAALKAVLAGT